MGSDKFLAGTAGLAGAVAAVGVAVELRPLRRRAFWEMAGPSEAEFMAEESSWAASPKNSLRPDADKAGFLDMRMRVADFTSKLA